MGADTKYKYWGCMIFGQNLHSAVSWLFCQRTLNFFRLCISAVRKGWISCHCFSSSVFICVPIVFMFEVVLMLSKNIEWFAIVSGLYLDFFTFCHLYECKEFWYCHAWQLFCMELLYLYRYFSLSNSLQLLFHFTLSLNHQNLKLILLLLSHWDIFTLTLSSKLWRFKALTAKQNEKGVIPFFFVHCLFLALASPQASTHGLHLHIYIFSLMLAMFMFSISDLHQCFHKYTYY